MVLANDKGHLAIDLLFSKSFGLSGGKALL